MPPPARSPRGQWVPAGRREALSGKNNVSIFFNADVISCPPKIALSPLEGIPPWLGTVRFLPSSSPLSMATIAYAYITEAPSQYSSKKQHPAQAYRTWDSTTVVSKYVHSRQRIFATFVHRSHLFSASVYLDQFLLLTLSVRFVALSEKYDAVFNPIVMPC